MSHQTKYELRELRNTDTDKIVRMFCNLPMNTPLMLVRTKGGRLGFKRLKYPSIKHPKIQQALPAEQMSLL